VKTWTSHRSKSDLAAELRFLAGATSLEISAPRDAVKDQGDACFELFFRNDLGQAAS
jgi:hypothetical protein